MFQGKKQSYGTANWWMSGHSLVLSRYLNYYYPIYDWGLIKCFFYENPIQGKVILEDYRKTNDEKQEAVINILLEGKSKIIYIVGGRGMGKSCLAGWIIQELHKKDERLPIYIVGQGILKEFPLWVHYKDRIEDVPNGGFIVLDEASIRYNAREFYKEANITLGKIMAIARHKEISVLFITQHIQLIDINITRLRDIIIWKKMNSYTFGERGASGGRSNKAEQFWNKVRMNMAPRDKEETLFEYPAERRFIHFIHSPPDFWKERLSTAFKEVKFEIEAGKVTQTKQNKKEVIYI